MFYVLLYSLLAFGSALLLDASNSFVTNIFVVLATIIAFYLMYKRYIQSFGGKAGFKEYYYRLLHIEDLVSVEENLINIEVNDNPDLKYDRAKEELTKIINEEEKYEIPNDGRQVVINDSRFKVSSKKWFFLLYVYNMESLYTMALSDWAFYIVQILTFIMLGFVILPLLIESWHGLKRSGYKKVLMWMFIATITMLGLNVINGIFFELVGFEVLESANQILIDQMIADNFLRMAFEVTIVASIFEELIFRGIFFRNIYSKNKFLAYIVTFFAFGIPHLLIGFTENGISEFMFLPIYGLMGVIFAFVYDKTDSIYTAMGAHLLNNLISVVILAFT